MAAINRLPHELWQRVFAFAAADPADYAFVHFWNNARQVCHTWRANVARAYFDTFIHDPARCAIYFDLGAIHDDDPNLRDLIMLFQFHRLDPKDPSRCIFSESQETASLSNNFSKEETKEYNDCKYSRWEMGLRMYLDGTGADEILVGRFDLAPYVLSVYGCANDGELCNLQVDWEQHEISFEWESTITAFCLELAELDRRNTGRSKSLGQQTRTSIPDPTKMALTMISAMRALVGMMSDNRQDVRRYRIKKLFRERYNLTFRDSWFDDNFEMQRLSRIERSESMFRDHDEGESEGDTDDSSQEYEDEETLQVEDGWLTEDE